MTIRFLQPVISPTGIRYILDNEGREIASISSLLDGVDNKARAKESEYIHNAICESFNSAAALRAENAKLREALTEIATSSAHLDDDAMEEVWGTKAAVMRRHARRALESSNE